MRDLNTTIPGGVYQWPDGRYHDAHGNEISLVFTVEAEESGDGIGLDQSGTVGLADVPSTLTLAELPPATGRKTGTDKHPPVTASTKAEAKHGKSTTGKKA